MQTAVLQILPLPKRCVNFLVLHSWGFFFFVLVLLIYDWEDKKRGYKCAHFFPPIAAQYCQQLARLLSSSISLDWKSADCCTRNSQTQIHASELQSNIYLCEQIFLVICIYNFFNYIFRNTEKLKTACKL